MQIQEKEEKKKKSANFLRVGASSLLPQFSANSYIDTPLSSGRSIVGSAFGSVSFATAKSWRLGGWKSSETSSSFASLASSSGRAKSTEAGLNQSEPLAAQFTVPWGQTICAWLCSVLVGGWVRSKAWGLAVIILLRVLTTGGFFKGPNHNHKSPAFHYYPKN